MSESLLQPDAFVEVFDRHYCAVHRYVHRRAGREIADEITSETFCQAFSQRERFDCSKKSVKPWLMGIATNLVRRKRRKETRQLRAYLKSGLDETFEPDPSASIDRLDAESYGHKIAEAILSLSPREREVISLYALADLSYEEIAQALGVTVGTVCKMMSRARERAGEILQPVEAYMTDGIVEAVADGGVVNG